MPNPLPAPVTALKWTERGWNSNICFYNYSCNLAPWGHNYLDRGPKFCWNLCSLGCSQITWILESIHEKVWESNFRITHRLILMELSCLSPGGLVPFSLMGWVITELHSAPQLSISLCTGVLAPTFSWNATTTDGSWNVGHRQQTQAVRHHSEFNDCQHAAKAMYKPRVLS